MLRCRGYWPRGGRCVSRTPARKYEYDRRAPRATTRAATCARTGSAEGIHPPSGTAIRISAPRVAARGSTRRTVSGFDSTRAVGASPCPSPSPSHSNSRASRQGPVRHSPDGCEDPEDGRGPQSVGCAGCGASVHPRATNKASQRVRGGTVGFPSLTPGNTSFATPAPAGAKAYPRRPFTAGHPLHEAVRVCRTRTTVNWPSATGVAPCCASAIDSRVPGSLSLKPLRSVVGGLTNAGGLPGQGVHTLCLFLPSPSASVCLLACVSGWRRPRYSS